MGSSSKSKGQEPARAPAATQKKSSHLHKSPGEAPIRPATSHGGAKPQVAIGDRVSRRASVDSDNRRLVARQLYEHSPMSITAVAALLGVNPRTVDRWAAAEGWQPRSRAPPDPAPSEAPVWQPGSSGPVPAPADLTDAIATLMDQAIARLRRDLAEGRTDPDRMVRAVAALAHAIQGLRAAEERRRAELAAKPNGGADDGRHADDPAGGGSKPSVADLHAELCRRLDEVEAPGDAPDGDESLDG